MSFQNEAQHTAISTAATTDILDVRAGATDFARVMPGMITIRNKGAADNKITVAKQVDAQTYEIQEFTLSADEDWFNDFDMVFQGTGEKLKLVTSSTSALDVIVSYVEKT